MTLFQMMHAQSGIFSGSNSRKFCFKYKHEERRGRETGHCRCVILIQRIWTSLKTLKHSRRKIALYWVYRIRGNNAAPLIYRTCAVHKESDLNCFTTLHLCARAMQCYNIVLRSYSLSFLQYFTFSKCAKTSSTQKEWSAPQQTQKEV